MRFSDAQHNLAELVFNDAIEVDPASICPAELLEKMQSWRDRPDHHQPGAELLQAEHCTLFSISYEGKTADYWPNESANQIGETLIRDFLYRDGICALSDELVRLFHIKYRMMAIDGDEYMLVCPYLTESQNISGIVVVCLTKMLRRPI